MPSVLVKNFISPNDQNITKITSTKVTDLRLMDYNRTTISVFKSVFNVGICLGLIQARINQNSKTRKLKMVLLWIQFILFHGTTSFIPLLLIRNTIGADWTRVVTVLSSITCFMGMSYVYTSSYFAFSKYAHNFCDVIDAHNFQCLNPRKRQILKTINNVGLVLIFVLLVFEVSFMMSYLYDRRIELKKNLWPLNFQDQFSTIGSLVLLTSWSFITQYQFVLLFILFLMASGLFIAEFGHINSRLKLVLQDSTAEEKFPILEKLRQEFTSLVECFELCNRLFSHLLFGVCVVTIPVVCFWMFGMIRNNLNVFEKSMTCMFASGTLTTVLIFIAVGAAINNRAHAPLDILTKVNLFQESEKTVQSISMFMSRLTGPPIGYSIYGLITLTTSTILQLVATLATYGIVMLQFSETELPISTDANNTIII